MLSLPKELQFFLEVRHPAWFSKEKEREDCLNFYLRIIWEQSLLTQPAEEIVLICI